MSAQFRLNWQTVDVDSPKRKVIQTGTTTMQEMQEWSGTPKQLPKQLKELLSIRFPDELKTWYRSPPKFVEELKKIKPALQEERILVVLPPEAALVTLTANQHETS